MGKIKLKMSIVSDLDNLKIETTGIRIKNKIIYKENDISVTILTLNNKIEMNRRSSDYEINLLFDNNSKSISSYTLFGSSKKFNLETITKKLIISSNKIELDYILEGNKFSYILEVEDL